MLNTEKFAAFARCCHVKIIDKVQYFVHGSAILVSIVLVFVICSFYLRYISESIAVKKGLQVKVVVLATTTSTCRPWQQNAYRCFFTCLLTTRSIDFTCLLTTRSIDGGAIYGLAYPCTKYYPLSMVVYSSLTTYISMLSLFLPQIKDSTSSLSMTFTLISCFVQICSLQSR